MEIRLDTFEKLTELKELDLTRDVFKPFLKGNQIQIIDSDLFFHNEYLHYINLKNNNLEIIQRKSFCNNQKRICTLIQL